jgi:hypothetical protein
MLPIANRKTLQIPHGLAALAAVICLILAFATDHASMQHERHTSHASPNSSLQHPADPSRNSEDGQATSRERRNRQGNLSLIPLFPLPGGARG